MEAQHNEVRFRIIYKYWKMASSNLRIAFLWLHYKNVGTGETDTLH